MFTRYCTPGPVAAIAVLAAVPARVGRGRPVQRRRRAGQQEAGEALRRRRVLAAQQLRHRHPHQPDGHILTVASQLLDTSDLVVHLYDGQRMKAQVRRRRAGTRRRPHQDPGRREEARGADWARPRLLRLRRGREAASRRSRATGCSRFATRSRSPSATSRSAVQRGVIIGVHEARRPPRHLRLPLHRRRVRRGRDHEQPRRGRRRAHRPQGEPARRHRPRDQEHA